jgi:hypothetical protein
MTFMEGTDISKLDIKGIEKLNYSVGIYRKYI